MSTAQSLTCQRASNMAVSPSASSPPMIMPAGHQAWSMVRRFVFSVL